MITQTVFGNLSRSVHLSAKHSGVDVILNRPTAKAINLRDSVNDLQA